MSSQHPWSVFAQSTQAKSTSEADGNSSDEDQDIPTMPPTSRTASAREGSLTSRSSRTRSGSFSAPGASFSAPGEGVAPGSGESERSRWEVDTLRVDALRGDFESAGPSESLINAVEDLLVDHFYRMEASVFKVECGLKAQTQVCEEQQRYMHDVSERVTQVSADQRHDRAHIFALKALRPSPEARATAPKAMCCFVDTQSTQPRASYKQEEGPAQSAASVDEFLCLRQDFDRQMARHEDRFTSFEQTMRHCSAELADLQAQLAGTRPASATGVDLQCHERIAPCDNVTSGDIQVHVSRLSSNEKNPNEADGKDAGSIKRGEDGPSNTTGKGTPRGNTADEAVVVTHCPDGNQVLPYKMAPLDDNQNGARIPFSGPFNNADSRIADSRTTCCQ